MKGWHKENYRHSLAAKGIKTSMARKSFQLSTWTPEQTEERAGLMKRYIEREPKTLEEMEKKKAVLAETEKGLKEAQMQTKLADIQAMKAEMGLAVAGAGAATAALMKGEDAIRNAKFAELMKDPGYASAVEDLEKSNLGGDKFVIGSFDDPLSEKNINLIGNKTHFQIGGEGPPGPISELDQTMKKIVEVINERSVHQLPVEKIPQLVPEKVEQLIPEAVEQIKPDGINSLWEVK